MQYGTETEGERKMTEIMPRLKPCPFCGCGQIMLTESHDHTKLILQCVSCDARFMNDHVIPSDVEHVKKVMYERWNRRVKE